MLFKAQVPKHAVNINTIQYNNLHIKLNGQGQNSMLRVNKVKALLET